MRLAATAPRGSRDTARHQSVEAGDTLKIMVSTKPAAKFKIEIFRTGYYDGAGGSVDDDAWAVRGCSSRDTAGGTEADTRMPVGRHRPNYRFPEIGSAGVYLGRLTTLPEEENQPYWQSYVVFIVRDDRPADILFQCSDNTWQAYNRWPDGYSVYTDPKGGQGPWSNVSFDRPYGKYLPDLREPTVDRFGRVFVLGVPHGLLAGTARLRRDLLFQRRPAHWRNTV